jgi:hypothetical protein
MDSAAAISTHYKPRSAPKLGGQLAVGYRRVGSTTGSDIAAAFPPRQIELPKC